MIAPSEKHLEDWIVSNFDTFVERGMAEYSTSNIELVARQYPLPSGRPDLILKTDGQLIVAELKKGVIDENCIAQAIRYIGDLKRLWFATFLEVNDVDYNYYEYDDYSLASGGASEIGGLIIGESVKKESLIFCSYAANLSVLTYAYTDNGYFFDRLYIPTQNTREHYQECSYGVVGQAMRNIMRHRTLTGKAQYNERARLHGWDEV